jgi:catechol 2,3-dioxygenase-like lactoylglutathione lyase family enzyme
MERVVHHVASMEVALVVADVDAVMPFYVDVLGFRRVSDHDVPRDKSATTGLSPTGYRIVRLETNLGDRLKLASPHGGAALRAPTDFPLASEGGAYVTFLIDNLDDVEDRLIAAGVPICSRGIVEVRPGVRLLLARDPAGNFLEFVQYADLGTYRPSSSAAR